jgi:rhodanese-related sulfurtransferase
MKTLPPHEVAVELARRGGTLLDVRSEAEFAALRAQPAVNVPLDLLGAAEALVRIDRSRPVYCICASGVRSAMALARLEGLGYDVVNVAGGTQAWAAAGLPIARG